MTKTAAVIIAVPLCHGFDSNGKEKGKFFLFVPLRAILPMTKPTRQRESSRRWRCTVALLMLCTVLAQALEGFAPPPRLVAIGDIHGDLVNAKEILRFMQVIDCSDHWSAGHDTVVQMGDVLDRGPHGHEVIDFFEGLQREARLAGGEFIQLLGNHELMNMQGDLKFVPPKTAEVFGGPERLKAAFDPVTGEYGSYLVDHTEIAVIRNRTVFVHGGLLAQFAGLGVEDINRRAKAAIRAKNFSDPILLNDGPMWTRDIIYPAQKGDCRNLVEGLKALSAYEVSQGRPSVDQMVIGHTIMENGAINFLCNDQLYAVDIAISQYMRGGGHLGAMEFHFPAGYSSGATSLANYTYRRARAEYPSQPFREHEVIPVAFPSRIPLPLVEENKRGVKGSALNIRVTGEALTHSEVVALSIVFLIASFALIAQRVECLRKLVWTYVWRGMKVKREDEEKQQKAKSFYFC